MDKQHWPELIKNGDRETFRELINEYRPLVYRTAARFLTNPDDCDDLTQEVFIEIWNSIHHFRGEAALSTWIYRITVNKSLNHLRKGKRLGWFLSRPGHQSDDGEPVSGPDATSSKLLNNEGARLIDAALAQLPDKQRTAFILTQAEGLSQKQAAGVMNMSESAVESLIHRARTSLRKKLKNYYTN